jgi:hypothetical protein
MGICYLVRIAYVPVIFSGWKKDVQRVAFQPVMLAAIVANVVSLGIAGAIAADFLRLH